MSKKLLTEKFNILLITLLSGDLNGDICVPIDE